MAAELATIAEVSMLGATATRGPLGARLRLPGVAAAVDGVVGAATGVAARGGFAAGALAWDGVTVVFRVVLLGASGLTTFGAAGAGVCAATLGWAGFGALGFAAAAPARDAGALVGAFAATPLASVLAAFGALAAVFLAAAGVAFLLAGLVFLSVLATCCLLVPGGMVPESGAFIPPLRDAIDGVGLGEVLSEGKPKLLKKESIHMARDQPLLDGLAGGGPRAAK